MMHDIDKQKAEKEEKSLDVCWLQNRRYELSPTPKQRDKKKVVALTKRFKDKVIFLADGSVIHPGWPCRLVSLSVSSLGASM